MKKRKKTENLGNIPKTLITSLEDPSKTSGNQKWKGAIDNLKKKPMQTRSKPKKKKASDGKKKFIPKFNNKDKSLKFVTPVAP